MPTRPRIIKLHGKTRKKLISIKHDAEQSGEYRVVKRIHAVLLSDQENSSTVISEVLDVLRQNVSKWLKDYEQYGYESLLEGHRSGRPSELSEKQLIELSDIIDAGPVAYGFTTAIWTSLMIRDIISNEFCVDYHSGHVRKILHHLNFSVQKPKRVLARADEFEKSRWRRYIYPNIKKKHAC